MATEALKAKELKRLKLFQKYEPIRQQLKKEGKWEELQKLPRNSSITRLRNRCAITGRPRGYMRFFGISRINFRELAEAGLIPGIKKASW